MLNVGGSLRPLTIGPCVGSPTPGFMVGARAVWGVEGRERASRTRLSQNGYVRTFVEANMTDTLCFGLPTLYDSIRT